MIRGWILDQCKPLLLWKCIYAGLEYQIRRTTRLRPIKGRHLPNGKGCTYSFPLSHYAFEISSPKRLHNELTHLNVKYPLPAQGIANDTGQRECNNRARLRTFNKRSVMKESQKKLELLWHTCVNERRHS